MYLVCKCYIMLVRIVSRVPVSNQESRREDEAYVCDTIIVPDFLRSLLAPSVEGLQTLPKSLCFWPSHKFLTFIPHLVAGLQSKLSIETP